MAGRTATPAHIQRLGEVTPAVPNIPSADRWAQRLRTIVVIAVFIAAVALIIANITTI